MRRICSESGKLIWSYFTPRSHDDRSAVIEGIAGQLIDCADDVCVITVVDILEAVL